jgi:hypothetical protein
MDDNAIDQTEEKALTTEISGEALEAAAGMKEAKMQAFTIAVCTGVSVCGTWSCS